METANKTTIRVGTRVKVECEKPFYGVVVLKFKLHSIISKQDEFLYHVKADDDGHTYEVRVGYAGCTGISKSSTKKAKSLTTK